MEEWNPADFRTCLRKGKRGSCPLLIKLARLLTRMAVLLDSPSGTKQRPATAYCLRQSVRSTSSTYPTSRRSPDLTRLQCGWHITSDCPVTSLAHRRTKDGRCAGPLAIIKYISDAQAPNPVLSRANQASRKRVSRSQGPGRSVAQESGWMFRAPHGQLQCCEAGDWMNWCYTATYKREKGLGIAPSPVN